MRRFETLALIAMAGLTLATDGYAGREPGEPGQERGVPSEPRLFTLRTAGEEAIVVDWDRPALSATSTEVAARRGSRSENVRLPTLGSAASLGPSPDSRRAA